MLCMTAWALSSRLSIPILLSSSASSPRTDISLTSIRRIDPRLGRIMVSTSNCQCNRQQTPVRSHAHSWIRKKENGTLLWTKNGLRKCAWTWWKRLVQSCFVRSPSCVVNSENICNSWGSVYFCATGDWSMSRLNSSNSRVPLPSYSFWLLQVSDQVRSHSPVSHPNCSLPNREEKKKEEERMDRKGWTSAKTKLLRPCGWYGGKPCRRRQICVPSVLPALHAARTKPAAAASTSRTSTSRLYGLSTVPYCIIYCAELPVRDFAQAFIQLMRRNCTCTCSSSQQKMSNHPFHSGSNVTPNSCCTQIASASTRAPLNPPGPPAAPCPAREPHLQNPPGSRQRGSDASGWPWKCTSSERELTKRCFYRLTAA